MVQTRSLVCDCAETSTSSGPAVCPAQERSVANISELAVAAVPGSDASQARNGATCAEFSWQGFDDADETCGRGWATIGTDGRLLGHIFIHQGDDSGFTCERE